MTGSPTALKKCKQCTQLAFDIETLGLNGHRDPVTIVCLENEFGDRHAFEFARVRWECMANDRDQTLEIARMVEEMSLVFDAAASLVAFNGIRFDLPFLQKSFNLCPIRVGHWLAKCSDPLEASRLSFLTRDYSTYKLDALCEANCIPMKTASGLQAIEWAKTGHFDLLLEYCTADVHILQDLYRHKSLINPKTCEIMQLTKIMHPHILNPPQAHPQVESDEAMASRDLQALLVKNDKLKSENYALKKKLEDAESKIATLTKENEAYEELTKHCWGDDE